MLCKAYKCTSVHMFYEFRLSTFFYCINIFFLLSRYHLKLFNGISLIQNQNLSAENPAVLLGTF